MGVIWGKKDSLRLANVLGVTLEEGPNDTVRQVGQGWHGHFVTWLTMYSRLKQRKYYRDKKAAER